MDFDFETLLSDKIKSLSATRKMRAISTLIYNTLSATRKFSVGDWVL